MTFHFLQARRAIPHRTSTSSRGRTRLPFWPPKPPNPRTPPERSPDARSLPPCAAEGGPGSRMKHLSPGDVLVGGAVGGAAGVGKRLPGRLLWRDAGGRQKLTVGRPGFYSQQCGCYRPRTNPFQPRPPDEPELPFASPGRASPRRVRGLGSG